MMIKAISTLSLCILGLLLVGPSSNADTTPVDSDASSSRLEWWQDAKFGMFIHWGVYSKAGGEWNGTTDHGEWLQFTAKIPLAEYREFAADFNPVEFDADEWARVAKDAGMKYMVITAKHHDGFAMYDSPSSPYDIMEASAFKRDPIKELAEACAKYGLKFCVYYSLGRDWEDPDVPTGGFGNAPIGFRSNLIDYPDESIKDFSKYYERKVKPQVRELLTQYGPIGIMWFDTYGVITEEQSLELRDMIRELQPDCIINSRIGHGLGDYGTPEQKIPSGKDIKPWETCMTITSKYWGYNKTAGYREPETLVRNLIDIVSKGGNYLLNVGPTGEGIIPEPNLERLKTIGEWLRINGEAIYACGPTPFGPEVGAYSKTEKDSKGKPKFVADWKWRATTKPDKLYIHLFEWPQTMEIPAVSRKITKAYLLSDPERTALEVVQTDSAVSVKLPAEAPDAIASVVCLEMEKTPPIQNQD